MNRLLLTLFLSLSSLCLCASVVSAADDPRPLEFRLTYDKSAFAGPFTGRVYVMLLPSSPRPLPSKLNWFNPEPTFARDVKGWKAGEPLTIADDALSHPTRLKDVKP